MIRNLFIALTLTLTALCSTQASAQQKKVSYELTKDIAYSPSTDAYARERCKLDVYRPKDKTGCPVVVWFHGGGLTGGSKDIPARLKEQGVIIVTANYRLLPRVPVDSAITDAAAAVAWTFRHAASLGGDPHRIYVSGHSAGGYLTMMVGLDKKWLGAYGVDADSIAALVPFSGQMISHFSYRKMHGYGPLQPLVDQYAPLFHVRKDCPPVYLITGDREIELYGRYEENAYMARMLRLVGHPDVHLYELDGHDHGAMADPAQHILLDVIHHKAR